MGNRIALGVIVGVIWAATFAIIAIDKALRERPPRVGDDKIRLPGTEPSVWMMLLLTLLCTFAALPYYFYNTRGPLGFVAGILLFVLCGALGYGARYAMMHYLHVDMGGPLVPGVLP
jgi:drug/metabolite transporter (DMT)-like permease